MRKTTGRTPAIRVSYGPSRVESGSSGAGLEAPRELKSAFPLDRRTCPTNLGTLGVAGPLSGAFPENRENSRGNAVPRKRPCALKTRGAHTGAEVRVVKNQFHRVRHVANVQRIEEESRAPGGLSKRCQARNHDWRTAGHRLERRKPKALDQAGKDEKQSTAIERGQLVIRDVAHHVNTLSTCVLRAAHEHEPEVGSSDAAEGIEQSFDVLVRARIADIEEIREAGPVAGAVGLEWAADSVAHVDHAFGRHAGPLENPRARVLGHRQDAVCAPAPRLDDAPVVQLLGRAQRLFRLDVNQIVNREDEGHRAKRRRIESRREKNRRLLRDDLGSKPERVRQRKWPRPAPQQFNGGQAPQNFTGKTADAVRTDPARVGKDAAGRRESAPVGQES